MSTSSDEKDYTKYTKNKMINLIYFYQLNNQL